MEVSNHIFTLIFLLQITEGIKETEEFLKELENLPNNEKEEQIRKMLEEALIDTEDSLKDIIKVFKKVKKEYLEDNNNLEKTIEFLLYLNLLTIGIYRKYALKSLLRLLDKGDFEEVYKMIKEMVELQSNLKLL